MVGFSNGLTPYAGQKNTNGSTTEHTDMNLSTDGPVTTAGQFSPLGPASNQKFDTGKSPIYRGFIKYFPRAIQKVADISQMGKNKYGEWGGWRNVDDAQNRYEDGKCRHMIEEAKGNLTDSESKQLHLAHAAWNAMAVLELYLLEQEGKDV